MKSPHSEWRLFQYNSIDKNIHPYVEKGSNKKREKKVDLIGINKYYLKDKNMMEA